MQQIAHTNTEAREARRKKSRSGFRKPPNNLQKEKRVRVKINKKINKQQADVGGHRLGSQPTDIANKKKGKKSGKVRKKVSQKNHRRRFFFVFF